MACRLFVVQGAEARRLDGPRSGHSTGLRSPQLRAVGRAANRVSPTSHVQLALAEAPAVPATAGSTSTASVNNERKPAFLPARHARTGAFSIGAGDDLANLTGPQYRWYPFSPPQARWAFGAAWPRFPGHLLASKVRPPLPCTHRLKPDDALPDEDVSGVKMAKIHPRWKLRRRDAADKFIERKVAEAAGWPKEVARRTKKMFRRWIPGLF